MNVWFFEGNVESNVSFLKEKKTQHWHFSAIILMWYMYVVRIQYCNLKLISSWYPRLR